MIASYSPSDWQNLTRENASLRAMVAELLITNQELRWELLGYRSDSVAAKLVTGPDEASAF